MVTRKSNADDTIRVYMCPRCGHIGISEMVRVPVCACGNEDIDWMVTGLPMLLHDIEFIQNKLLKQKEEKP